MKSFVERARATWQGISRAEVVAFCIGLPAGVIFLSGLGSLTFAKSVPEPAWVGEAIRAHDRAEKSRAEKLEAEMARRAKERQERMNDDVERETD